LIADVDEDRQVRGTTLALAALATASAELAIAGPERSPGTALARAAALVLGALMVYLWTGHPSGTDREGRGASAGGSRPRRPATLPIVVIALLSLLLLVRLIEIT
jgi:hypothetical protein